MQSELWHELQRETLRNDGHPLPPLPQYYTRLGLVAVLHLVVLVFFFMLSLFFFLFLKVF